MIAGIIASAFWLCFIVFTSLLFCVLGLCRLGYYIAGRDRFDLLAHRFGWVWARVTLALGPRWKVSLIDQSHLRDLERSPAVIVSNHASMTDIWIISSLGVQFRFLSKIEVFKTPIIGTAMRWAGYIPIKRGDKQSHQDALRLSAECLKRGVSMLYFPEGTRSVDGVMLPFKIGAFKLASECDVAILPIVITGTENMLPKGSAIPHPAHVRVKIMDPMRHHAGEDYQAFADRVRNAMSTEKQKLLN